MNTDLRILERVENLLSNFHLVMTRQFGNVMYNQLTRVNVA